MTPEEKNKLYCRLQSVSSKFVNDLISVLDKQSAEAEKEVTYPRYFQLTCNTVLAGDSGLRRFCEPYGRVWSLIKGEWVQHSAINWPESYYKTNHMEITDAEKLKSLLNAAKPIIKEATARFKYCPQYDILYYSDGVSAFHCLTSEDHGYIPYLRELLGDQPCGIEVTFKRIESEESK